MEQAEKIAINHDSIGLRDCKVSIARDLKYISQRDRKSNCRQVLSSSRVPEDRDGPGPFKGEQQCRSAVTSP